MIANIFRGFFILVTPALVLYRNNVTAFFKFLSPKPKLLTLQKAY